MQCCFARCSSSSLLLLFYSAWLQLTKRYEAAVRVCQWNSGTHSRPRNIGNILEKEKEIQAQLKGEGALAA